MFFCPEGARNGGKELKPGRRVTADGYAKAWDWARTAAGCAGRLSHDFRYAIVSDADLGSGVEKPAGYISGYTRKATAAALARQARNASVFNTVRWPSG